jgi:CheY-like chemotaxis protein/two-component sensor histidine kinase
MAREEPSEMAPVDLTTVIESALEVTAYSIRSSGIEVSLRMAKALPTVMADADQMRQVFTNLILNAKDALQSVEGTRRLRITASHRKQSDLVIIKVKDNGPGIPAEIRTRVFEPLYTTKEIGTGTGVGLALCHRIVEAHGGSIVVEGAQGDGAIFAIRLPRAKQAEVPAASKRRSVGKVTKGRVLVVEDEPDVREIISDVLEHDGHSVDVAASGDLALQKIRRQRYDVILSDIRMPGMDGPGFYRALSDTKPEQIRGLAFITGDTLSPQAREFLNASERPYLEKPLTPRDIRELVDLLMRRKAS